MTAARGIYSIGAIARMLGLSQATIRSWEDRYGIIVAERTDGGRRIYTREQLEQLRFVMARLSEGLSAADAHRLLAEDQADRGMAAQRRTSPGGTRSLILLADADRYGAELTGSSLRTHGYDVEIARSAEDAEEGFTTRDPALAIVDLMISGGVGRQLCERLRRLRDTPLLTISSVDLREQALAAGADAFLQKPVDPMQVIAAVKDLLGARAGTHDEGPAADG